MRYFLCPFGHFSLGIPEDAVAAIMTYADEASAIVKRKEGEDIFFSLPHFFKLTDKTARHGVVLKPLNQLAPGQNPPEDALNTGEAAEEGPRNVLLVSAVEREVDIAPEKIFSMPEITAAPGRIPFFTGACFTGDDMIVFVDPASLIARILRDTEGRLEV